MLHLMAVSVALGLIEVRGSAVSMGIEADA